MNDVLMQYLQLKTFEDITIKTTSKGDIPMYSSLAESDKTFTFSTMDEWAHLENFSSLLYFGVEYEGIQLDQQQPFPMMLEQMNMEGFYSLQKELCSIDYNGEALVDFLKELVKQIQVILL